MTNRSESSSLHQKTLSIYTSISNVYSDEDERCEISKIEILGDITEDVEAMLLAMKLFIDNISDDIRHEDLIGFTHILNRVAVQYLLDEKTRKDIENA